jgi:6-phosphofructokinase 2
LDKSTSTNKMTPEQKLRCTDMRLDAGGGGINVSKGVSKLGGDTVAVFPQAGHNGLIVRSLLEDLGVRVQTVPLAGETRESMSVTETSTNLQYRFTLPGLALTLKDADACLDLIRKIGPDYLVASGSLPPGLPETYFEEVAVFAKKNGMRFILDTSGVPLRAAADEGVYLLKPNLGELCALAGVDSLEMNQVDDAALSIIHQGKCEVVVVSMGPQGALLVTNDELEHIPAPPVPKKTTVGAGDSMVAGMVWALSEGKTKREMAQYGVACGSAATMNKGTELFHPGDIGKLLTWIQTYGERYRFTDF